MSVDMQALYEERIQQLANSILNPMGELGDESQDAIDQYDAALILRVSPLWQTQRQAAELFLKSAAQRHAQARSYFFEWAGAVGQYDLLTRDVFCIRAAMQNVDGAKAKVAQLCIFNNADGLPVFQPAVCAYQRYQILQGLMVHETINSGQYRELLTELEVAMKNGSLSNDPKVQDKIDRESTLHFPSESVSESWIKNLYTLTIAEPGPHKKFTDVKETVLGEKIVVDYWKGLFELPLPAALLFTIPAAIVFPFYWVIKKAFAEDSSVIPQRTQVEEAQIYTAIQSGLERIKTERIESKKKRISRQYGKFYQPAGDNPAEPRQLVARSELGKR